MMLLVQKLNRICFDERYNISISLWEFWLGIVVGIGVMVLRWLITGFDLFEQVLLFVSFWAIVTTARGNVIACKIEKKTSDT